MATLQVLLSLTSLVVAALAAPLAQQGGYSYPQPAGATLEVGGHAGTGSFVSGGSSAGGHSTSASTSSALFSGGSASHGGGGAVGGGAVGGGAVSGGAFGASSSSHSSSSSSSSSHSSSSSSSSSSASGGAVEIIEIIADERQAPDETGAYSFTFETADGIKRSETGSSSGADGPVVTQGEYSYTMPDGQVFTLTFIADENGYQPESPLLPPLPEFVLQQIAFAEAEAAAGGSASGAGGSSGSHGGSSGSQGGSSGSHGGSSGSHGGSSGSHGGSSGSHGGSSSSGGQVPSGLYSGPGRQ